MSAFRVYMTMTISTCRTVEADSAEEAEELAYQEHIPGVMFLDHTYPDVGDWEVDSVEAVNQ